MKLIYGQETRTYGITVAQASALGIDLQPSALQPGCYKLPFGTTLAQFEEMIGHIDGAMTTTTNATDSVTINLSVNGQSAEKTITPSNFTEYKGENSWYAGDTTISTYSQLTPGMTVRVAGKQNGNI